MTPDLFCRIGEAMYGPNWKGAVAYDLGMNTRKVQRYAAGEVAISEWAAAAMTKAITDHQIEVTEICTELKSQEN